MRIARVHIEHFRSIKEANLEPGSLCVLIGENNAGKSNILRALNLALGETWPTERSFSDDDFHGLDTTKDIVIQIFFDTETEIWRNKHKMKVAGIELRCHAYVKKTGAKQRGDLKVEYQCITAKGEACKYPAEPNQFKGPWMDLRVSSELREKTPLIYVDVLRNYDRHNPGSRWSILRRLLNEVNTEFANDPKAVTVTMPDGSKAKMTRREAFERAVKDAYGYLRTDTFVKLEELIAKNTLEQMGVSPGAGGVSLHFESHDPTHVYRSLELYVDEMGIESPAGEVGSGLQSAIVVGIFRTYEELKKSGAIFVVEEPEIFLHPQKARYFAGVLARLADQGNQVMVSTHSPVFVQIDRPETVAVVRRTAEKGTWVRKAAKVDLAATERQALRLMTEFDAQRNELFFAKRVMFVEGMTEKVALPLAFRALGFDVNREGISVVECGGKTKLSLFVRVAKALEIPYVALVDYDIREIKAEWSDARKKKEEERNKKHLQWNAELEKVADKDRLFFLTPSFEAELGLPEAEDEKIDNALKRFESAKAADIPACLEGPIERLTA
jgi:predicted ATP-dependent endonuclease of OLD family